MRSVIFFLLVLLCSIVRAGTIDPSKKDKEYIEYGSKHGCVLPIMGIMDDKMNSNFRGSCVIIDPYHVLTAAHIVEKSLTQHVIYGRKVYPCRIVAIHALYNNDKVGFHDIALIRLQQPINLDYYPELYTDRDEKGKICSMAGYGFYGNFNTGYLQKNYDNKKRAGSNFIDGIEDNVLTFSASKPGKKSTSLEFLITPGDSGGGLFIDKKLAGIHSFVYARDNNVNSDYGDVGCSTRVSDYIDWIKQTKIIIKEVIEAENEKRM